MGNQKMNDRWTGMTGGEKRTNERRAERTQTGKKIWVERKVGWKDDMLKGIPNEKIIRVKSNSG